MVYTIGYVDYMKYITLNIVASGAVPSPYDCYMVNRGVKTLHVRMRAHSENGLAVAKFLESNSRVEKVTITNYPNEHAPFRYCIPNCHHIHNTRYIRNNQRV